MLLESCNDLFARTSGRKGINLDVIATAMIKYDLINYTWKNVKQFISNDGLRPTAQQRDSVSCFKCWWKQ